MCITACNVMRTRTHRPLLFPYTTLFRSYSRRHRAEWLAKLVEPAVRIRAEHLYQQLDSLEPVRQAARGELLGESRKHAAVKDRKSTRLNSSHRCISYAVFCLKNKIYIIS